MRLFLLTLLTACGTTITPTCDVEAPYAISLDERTSVGTLQELLDSFDGLQVDFEGRPALLFVELDGTATFTDHIPGSNRKGSLPPYTQRSISVPCDDVLRAPVRWMLEAEGDTLEGEGELERTDARTILSGGALYVFADEDEANARLE